MLRNENGQISCRRAFVGEQKVRGTTFEGQDGPGRNVSQHEAVSVFSKLTVANPCENKPKRNRLSCDELRPARALSFPRSYRFSADLRQSHTEICSTACFGWKSANLMVRLFPKGLLIPKRVAALSGATGRWRVSATKTNDMTVSYVGSGDALSYRHHCVAHIMCAAIALAPDV